MDTVPGIDSAEEPGNYHLHKIKTENDAETLFGTEYEHMEDPLESQAIKIESNISEDEDVATMNIEEESMTAEPGLNIKVEDVSWLKVEDEGDVKREGIEDAQDTQPKRNSDFRTGGGDGYKGEASNRGYEELICDDVKIMSDEGENSNAADSIDKRSAKANCSKVQLKTHSRETKFACGLCDDTFSRADRLEAHMVIHKGETSYACHFCDFKCSSGCRLKRHLRTHTGAKPFLCDVCSNTFRQSAHLKRHMKIHTGEKPFACDVCDFRCSQAGNLKRHMSFHTGDKPFACDVCSYKCSNGASLKNHMKVHRGETRSPVTRETTDADNVSN